MADKIRVKAVFDNGGVTADRYTVVTTSSMRMFLGPLEWESFTFSSDCHLPNGVNLYVPVTLPNAALGKKIRFSQLPKQVQKCARRRLASGS